jgi:hypothetical protein
VLHDLDVLAAPDRPAVGPVNGYRRPVAAEQVFRAPDGTPIPYGRRWAGSPPENTYSVVTHPERYAPLGVVADALLAHLADTFEVTVTPLSPEAAAGHFRGYGATRAVEVVPRSPDGARLVMAWTGFPGVGVRAGELFRVPFPVCGCDACDESVEGAAEELETVVLAVAEGRFAESLDGDCLEHTFLGPDGAFSSSQRGSVEDTDRARLAVVRERLGRLPDGWQPWPRRPPAGAVTQGGRT